MIDHLAETGAGKSPELDESALNELSATHGPAMCASSCVLERAVVMFPDQTVSSTQVRENLLRMKAPDRAEEMSALWEASQDLMGIDIAQDSSEPPLRTRRIMPTGSAISTASTCAAICETSRLC